MLVRFVAASGIGMSVIEIALAGVQFKYRGTPVNYCYVIFWLILSLICIIILIKAKAVADWISDKLDM